MRGTARALGRWAVRPEGEGFLVAEGLSRLASPTRSPGARIVENDQAAETERLLGLLASQVDWRLCPEGADFVVLAAADGNRICAVAHG